MSGSLVDGLAAVGDHHHDERLTDCACWCVEFDHYAFQPVIVAPFETGLETIEAIARRRLFEELIRHGPYSSETDPLEYEAKRAEQVAALRVLSVKRRADVALDPRLG